MLQISCFVLLSLPTSTARPAEPPWQRAVDLPLVAEQLREAGVAPSEVEDLLHTARTAGLSVASTHDLLWHATAAARVYGPLDDLASYVATQLDAGVRGDPLATALQREHMEQAGAGGSIRHATKAPVGDGADG